ncbi:MAG TPA: acyltransferase, partial [Thermoanaerobaculia bacterium]
RYRAIVEAPLPIDTEGDRDAAVRRNIERYVALLERYVREYPEQWYCFYPFWDDPSRKKP